MFFYAFLCFFPDERTGIGSCFFVLVVYPTVSSRVLFSAGEVCGLGLPAILFVFTSLACCRLLPKYCK